MADKAAAPTATTLINKPMNRKENAAAPPLDSINQGTTVCLRNEGMDHQTERFRSSLGRASNKTAGWSKIESGMNVAVELKEEK